jgi:hypothetical protein
VSNWYRSQDGIEDDEDDSDGVVKWKKKHWTMRKVVGALKRADIDEKIGEEAGNPNYMGAYAGALNEVVDSLSDDAKKEYMELARVWNKSHPPKDVQIR